MSSKPEILIAGAGPSGLSLAIFLHEKGYHPRIIDKKPVISQYSKAFGVNPRSLTILDEFGVAKRFLENGRKMTAMNIWRNGKVFFRNDFSAAKHKYPFNLIQSQRESEQVLLEEVSARKITVEYGVQLDSVERKEGRYVSVLKKEDSEQHYSDYIIGADGAHSEVRKQLGLPFEGFGYKGTWELYDVELEVDLPKDDANLFFFNDGGMILIRIKDNLWRAAGNLKDLLNYMPKNTRVGGIKWSTKFNINHVVAQTLVQDNAVIIGDAAHIHSPLGGRGMNLGIEDAYLVSRLISENRLHEYTAMRRSYLLKTVRRINGLTTFVAANSGFPLFLKKCSWMAQPFLPLARPMIRNFALGIS